MIDPIKRKPISKPKPYKDSRGKYKWVVYFHDPKKDVRAKKLFVDKFSADEFYSTQSLVENKLGAEANNISFEDRKDILEAKRILENFDITFLDAIRTYADLSTELLEYKTTLPKVVEEYKNWAKIKKQSVSLRRAIEAFLDSKNQEQLTTVNYRRTLETELERFCESFGDKTIVAQISNIEIEDWLNNLKTRVYVDSPTETLKGKPRKVYVETDTLMSITSRKGYRTTLYTFFRFCKMRDWVEENPMEKIASIRAKLRTPEIFKVDEIAYILSKTEPMSDLRVYIAIGAFAGLRSAEILRLTWDKIKLADREIVMNSEMTKTGSRRVVKITENLAKWLSPYEEYLKTTDLVVKPNFYKRLDDFRKANNIKWVNNGLRHSAATYYLALTKNAYLTAEQMGHAVDVLKQHYNGLAREKEAIAYFNIEPK